MPTNANTFNSRVTSEALEAKFRDVFPSQGGAELVQDLFASGVIQPVVDFSSVAEGSALPQNLQTAWDFSTGSVQINNATTNIVTNTGFWQVDVLYTGDPGAPSPSIINVARLELFDGASAKPIWGVSSAVIGANTISIAEGRFVTFLRAGDTLRGVSSGTAHTIDVWYRQIADVNGTLVNPLGFTFQ